MRNNILILLMTLILAGCGAAFSGLAGKVLGSDKPAIGVDAQIGAEANRQVVVGDQDRQEYEFEVEGPATITNETSKTQTRQDFQGGVENVKVTNISPLFLILLVLGWLLPTPQGIIKYIVLKKWKAKSKGNE